MELTPFGIIFIPFVIFLSIFKDKTLFYLAIFFSAFHFASVLNLPALGNATYVRPTYFIIIIILLKTFFNNGFSFTIKYDLATLFLIFFTLISFISSSMPLFLNDVYVIGEESYLGIKELKYTKLELSRSSLTQLLYPLYWTIVFIFFNSTVSKKLIFKHIINIFCYSGILLMIFGFYFQFFSELNSNLLNYFNYFFFKDPNYLSPQEWGIVGELIPRMFTFAGEPSNSALFFTLILGPVFGDYLDNKNLKSLLVSLLLFLSILMTISTGGVILIFFFIEFYLFFVFLQKGFKSLINFFLINIIILIFTLILIDQDSEFIIYHFEKITTLSKSGLIRFTVISHNIKVFLQSPFFGVGYGNERGLTLATFLLANSGILGFCLFYGFYFSIILKGLKSNNGQKYIKIGIIASLFSLLMGTFISFSESIILMPYIWIFLIISNVYFHQNINYNNTSYIYDKRK